MALSALFPGPPDSEGDAGDCASTRIGGQRFYGDGRSEEYATILEWPRGGG